MRRAIAVPSLRRILTGEVTLWRSEITAMRNGKKELAKQKKREEKRLRKLEKSKGVSDENSKETQEGPPSE